MTKEYKKIKDNVYAAEKNFVKKASEFFIAVAVDKNGREGLVAQLDLSRLPPVEKPMIGASKQDIDAIMVAAKRASEESDAIIRILRFSECEVFAEFVPKNLN